MLVEPLFDKTQLSHGQVRRLTAGVYLIPSWGKRPPIAGDHNETNGYMSLSSVCGQVSRIGTCDDYRQVLAKYDELEWSPRRRFSVLLYAVYRNDHSQAVWADLFDENYLGKLTPDQSSVVFHFCICDMVTYMYSWQYDPIARVLVGYNRTHLTNEDQLEGSSTD